MGGDSDQPYIYEPSLQNRRTVYPYSDFNPKSVSQASYQALKRKEEQKKKAKQDGPLINFNQHPDSYMIVAGQNVQYKPMSAKTPKIVAGVRWTQFSLRILEEVGAIGLLVAVICLKNIETALSWIVRIAVSETKKSVIEYNVLIPLNSQPGILLSRFTPSIISLAVLNFGHQQARPATIRSLS